ncbi:LysR family transcriptional regulator [Macrococcus capreoli]|uniref:LysR family transcriptional regulator n=1 Tax=Macrococcus capreoli TaxID=2982690 RepID=UPI0021D56C43|nr:LysR family transcriptional regulator [Macrococcus sp. TMW 2.2395]MCU7557889.1 LysR family transcriptional regulator [Macrococcus sp. TMW 2.2395]
MNIKQLKLFKLFVETKNVNTVAEMMQISQPTVSFHLKNLQDSYDTELFRKKGNNFTLTSSGEMLYLNATQIISLMDETERLLEEFGESARGSLTIGASNTPLNHFLPNIFKAYMKAYPKIKLSVVVDTAPKIVEKIKEREIDLAIISEVGILNSDFVVKRLFENPLVYVMDKHHPLAQLDKITHKSIQQYDFIIHKSGSTRQSIDRWQAKHLLDIKVAMEINSISSILQMVEGSEFVGIISKAAIAHNHDIVYRVLEDEQEERYISLIYKKDRLVTKIMQDFISILYKHKEY